MEKEGQSFGEWFNTATVKEVAEAMADRKSKEHIESELRGNGGRHEWFPVSKADKAKELGFKFEELMELTSPREDVWFQFVADPKKPGKVLSGPHSTGKALPPGQSARASYYAHADLSERLEKTQSKKDALRTIEKFMVQHVKNGRSMARDIELLQSVKQVQGR